MRALLTNLIGFDHRLASLSPIEILSEATGLCKLLCLDFYLDFDRDFVRLTALFSLLVLSRFPILTSSSGSLSWKKSFYEDLRDF